MCLYIASHGILFWFGKEWTKSCFVFPLVLFSHVFILKLSFQTIINLLYNFLFSICRNHVIQTVVLISFHGRWWTWYILNLFEFVILIHVTNDKLLHMFKASLALMSLIYVRRSVGGRSDVWNNYKFLGSSCWKFLVVKKCDLGLSWN